MARQARKGMGEAVPFAVERLEPPSLHRLAVGRSPRLAPTTSRSPQPPAPAVITGGPWRRAACTSSRPGPAALQGPGAGRTRRRTGAWEGFFILLCGATFLGALEARAATVGLGEATGSPGQTQVGLPLSLTASAGEQITDIAVDVYFDPSLAQWQSIVLEPGVAALAKQVEVNQLVAGHVRIVIYGLDRQTLSAGTLGQCLIQVRAAATPGTTIISLQSGLGSTPDGVDVPLGVLDGRLWITASVDTTPPRIGGVVASNVTGTTATVTWTTDEPAQTTLQFGSTTAYGISVDGETAWSTAHTATLTGLPADSPTHFLITAVDPSGNHSDSGDQTLRTLPSPDTTPPSLTVSSPVEGARIAYGQSMTVAGAASDDRAGVAVKVNGVTVALGANGGFSYPLSALAAGSLTIQVIATDAAGNRTTASRTVTVDSPMTTAPTVTITGPLSGGTVSGSSVTITFTVANITMAVGGPHLHLQLDNGTVMHLYSVTSYGWYNIPAGTHTIGMRLVDGSHTPLTNPEAHSVVTFTVQSSGSSTTSTSTSSTTTTTTTTTGPSVLINAPLNGSTTGSTITLLFTVSGTKISLYDAHLHIQLDSGPVWHVYNTDPFGLRGLALGQHKIAMQLVDKYHNKLSGTNTFASTTFTVK